MALRYVKEQNLKYVWKQLNKMVDALKYVKKQTPEICMEAIRQNGNALHIMSEEQTPEICLEAVKQNGKALQDVREQTPEICMEAVKQNGNAIQYVKEQTPEICLEAVKQNGNVKICQRTNYTNMHEAIKKMV